MFVYRCRGDGALQQRVKIIFSKDAMIKAMDYMEGHFALYVVEEPKLGAEMFNYVVSDALEELYFFLSKNLLYKERIRMMKLGNSRNVCLKNTK